MMYTSAMSLSAKQLEQYLPLLRASIVGHHLAHPLFYCENTLYFHLSGEEHRFVISLDDAEPRVYAAKEAFDGNGLESKFLDVLKKELANAYVSGIEQVGEDRVLRFSLTVINSVFKEEGRYLIFEAIPHHANLILLDEEDVILAAFRPGEMSDERPCLRGLHYLAPEKKDFLPKPEAPFDDKAYLAHCVELEAALAEKRKKDRFGFLFESLKKKAKLVDRKIEAIQRDIAQAEAHLNDGVYGDAIFMLGGNLQVKAASFVYEGETLALDPAKTLSQNAQFFYKRAKKAKEAMKRGEENLLLSQKEKADTQSALAQLSLADEAGLELLAKELDIHPQMPSEKKKVKEWKGLSGESLPYCVSLGGTKILFGRSAKQNDCLSFLFDTAKEHAWLHVMGNSGSHVMIKKDKPTSEEIETAAELALFESGENDGEVMLAKRGDVRKGPAMGMAIVKSFQTLRIKTVTPAVKALAASARKIEL